MIMIKELQEKLDFWNNLRDEVQMGDVPADLKYQMLSEVEYQIVVIEDQLDKLMQNNTLNAMTLTLIAFCAAATGLFGYAMTVKYLV
jgi:chromosome condensin MukBEF complex kleisin-like MukF subunit